MVKSTTKKAQQVGKPAAKVIVALANKMARMAWAVLAHQQDYRAA